MSEHTFCFLRAPIYMFTQGNWNKNFSRSANSSRNLDEGTLSASVSTSKTWPRIFAIISGVRSKRFLADSISWHQLCRIKAHSKLPRAHAQLSAEQCWSSRVAGFKSLKPPIWGKQDLIVSMSLGMPRAAARWSIVRPLGGRGSSVMAWEEFVSFKCARSCKMTENWRSNCTSKLAMLWKYKKYGWTFYCKSIKYTMIVHLKTTSNFWEKMVCWTM